MAQTVKHPDIHRDHPLMLGLRLPMTAAWIALRLLLVPVLYIPYRMGRSTRWAHEVDAFLKRLCFPLTESADVSATQTVVPALRVGDAIPDEQIVQGDRMLSLAALTEEGPLLLVLYRGNWCPYSRLHLAHLAASYPRFQQAGISVLGVTAHSRTPWWRSKGIELPMAEAPTGELFAALGVKAESSLPNRVWGQLVPHESVFLFERGGKLIACDVRRISSYKLGQKFLAADAILDMAGARVP